MNINNLKLQENINGILLVNKPKGPSSNSILQHVKRLFGAKKAGHTGSLDPMASGMLPICFGEATKVSNFLLDADKIYEVTGLLGIKTNTSDAMGEVIAQNFDFDISESSLNTVLNNFIGNTKQVPSMFSALKYEGMPLYKYAREGINIERKARDVTIYSLTLNNFNGKYFKLTVHCSKGTYIRNLVEDIGDQLLVGAHVTKLHRTSTASFYNHQMYSIDDLTSMTLCERRALLLPTDTAIKHIPQINLTTQEATLIKQGQVLKKINANIFQNIVRLYDNHEKFLGVGEFVSTNELKAKRLLNFATTCQDS